jgi:phospholipase C
MFAGTLVNPTIAGAQSTTTPIKHLVVIFQENISFDHYFGTYPNATNPAGEPRFIAKPGTPGVNGYTNGLLYNNPNALNSKNGTGASGPFRLDRSEASTMDQDHDYMPEQQAFDNGLMDLFPLYTGVAGPPPNGQPTNGLVMGYFDGNTVTAYWNYAQRFAMSDNSYDTNFGPSTDGALNLISGQLNGVGEQQAASGSVVSDGSGGYTLVSDADPLGDMCSTTTGAALTMTGTNVGELLSAAGVTWGFFEGGFDLTATNANGTTGCSRSTTSTVTNTNKADYIPHHEPFQYYAATANLGHTRPTSPATVGMNGDPANHQYDTHDFFDALKAGNFPAVSYLKAPGYQDGHAGYSDPLDEQTFVTTVINTLMQQPDWSSTAVIIAYDDSDGWYDHQMGPIVNQSTSPMDALTGPNQCGTGAAALAGVTAEHAQGRCGYGPRLPMLVISPYSKQNYVDHVVTDQSSILRFVEDNWLGSQRIPGSFDTLAGRINTMFDFKNPDNRPLILNTTTGLVTQY